MPIKNLGMTWALFPCHHQEMRTHAHHLGLRFSDADNVKEAFATGLVFPFLREVRREPNATFHGDGFLRHKTRLSDFQFHLIRSSEIRFRDEPRIFRRTDMVARGHFAFDHVEKHGVIEEFHERGILLLAIDRQSPSHGTELGDARCHQETVFLQHSECLTKRLQAFFPIAQMILWSHQQHHIGTFIRTVDLQGIARLGYESAIQHHIGFGIIHGVLRQLDQMHLIAFFRQPSCIHPDTATDVVNHLAAVDITRQDFLRPVVLHDAQAALQPTYLGTIVIEVVDFAHSRCFDVAKV